MMLLLTYHCIHHASRRFLVDAVEKRSSEIHSDEDSRHLNHPHFSHRHPNMNHNPHTQTHTLKEEF